MGGWRSSAASPQILHYWGLAALDRQPPSINSAARSHFAVLLLTGPPLFPRTGTAGILTPSLGRGHAARISHNCKFFLMPSVVVRYGQMRFQGVFTTSGGREYARGVRVIVRTDRGLEAGEVLCESNDEVVARMKDPMKGQILREMTAEDAHELEKIRHQAGEEIKVCQRQVERLELAMQLVDVEHLFGGERIVVYYLADNRVDFRELVKLLAGEFQTRIEMRQIGVRDEAKLLADFGDCGVPVCCNNHLAQMPPVSMKMAKVQKATLDPTKISGRCGRLKCCLRYEYETYEQILKELPALGSMVATPEGTAKVIGHEVLTQQVMVVTEDRRRILVPAADVSLAPVEKKNGENHTDKDHTDKDHTDKDHTDTTPTKK